MTTKYYQEKAQKIINSYRDQILDLEDLVKESQDKISVLVAKAQGIDEFYKQLIEELQESEKTEKPEAGNKPSGKKKKSK